ncbi:MAG: hypothetical protein A2234_01970 [Elusimicrobia bacterium RIFOXYA2_FULL_58_8]|nr:MAG: hypothetical protein A2285_04605 [Elusimicrobia bacterium RIFOXYA12_FULL_57_11]OGS12590.1 MAG: hypothetical protein A2234_01970 [Elusimicrobia bacterium RIFOXYA2_FULL_58_8]
MQENDPLIIKCTEIREKGTLKLAVVPALSFFMDAFSTPETLKSLRVELTFSVVDGPILMEGRVNVEMHLECARCAAPVTSTFSDSFDELYPDTVEYIDARELIRETAALLVPLKVVCSESCKGRCPQCGIELNKESCSCVMDKSLPFRALEKFAVKKDTPPKGGGKPKK